MAVSKEAKLKFVRGLVALALAAALVLFSCLLIACWSGEDAKTQAKAPDGDFRIGQTVSVQVPADLLDKLRATNKEWGCYLNGRFLPECPPTTPETSQPPKPTLPPKTEAPAAPEAAETDKTAPPAAQTRTVRFLLERTSGNREVWRLLLANDLPRRTELELSVGMRDGTIVGAVQKKLVWTPLSPDGPNAKTSVLLVVIGLVLFAVILLSSSTNWLKDPLPEGQPTGCRHWSLGRVQLLFWFLNVLIGFLFIWSLTGSTDRLTAFALGVLLVGGATAGGANATNNAKDQRAATLRAELAAAGTTATRKLEIPAALAPVQRGTSGTSCRFWSDLLSDKDGTSLARFQYVLWTVMLGIAFWGSVLRNLSMPDFDPTFLVLMGISGGTYLAMKQVEKPK